MTELICRTCLKVINNDELYINAESYTNYGEVTAILEACVSELNLDVTNKVVICCSCFAMLRISYNFKVKCLNTEERVFAYLQKNNFSLHDRIRLSDVILNNDESRIKECSRNMIALPENDVFSNIPAYNSSIRNDDVYKQVDDSYANKIYINAQPNIKKQNEIPAVIFDNVAIQNQVVEDNYKMMAFNEDCNMFLENCRLDSKKEYFGSLLGGVNNVSVDDLINFNGIHQIM